MVKGTTKSGFEYHLDPAAFTDAEFLEDFVAIRDGNDQFAFFHFLVKLLGAEQKKALYDHVRTEDGKVPVPALTAEVAEMMTALGEAAETKN